MKFRSSSKICLLILCLHAFSSLANAQSIAIIVNKSNDIQIEKPMLKRIFLSKVRVYPESRENISIMWQPDENEIYDLFLQKVLQRKKPQVNAYWSRMLFTGKALLPEQGADDSAVIDFVKNNPQGIGYVYSSSVTEDVRVIATYP